MNIKEPWVINKTLTLKEREILFIILSSADIKIFETTRIHIGMNDWPYITFNERNLITGTNKMAHNDRQVVTYEEVVEELEKLIKLRKV